MSVVRPTYGRRSFDVVVFTFMAKRILVASLLLMATPALRGALPDDAGELGLFQRRLAEYAGMHRRLEQPDGPLTVTRDMDHVHRRMDALRTRIRSARKGQTQGYFFNAAMVELLRRRVGGCLTSDEIAETMDSIAEHTPPGMQPLRVNYALPEDAPFGLVPARVIEALPRLPLELRYVVLAGALILWDDHADLVVDIAPGVFDAESYRKKTW
jgi:hypothetical protein